jgi:hypothetical protein
MRSAEKYYSALTAAMRVYGKVGFDERERERGREGGRERDCLLFGALSYAGSNDACTQLFSSQSRFGPAKQESS